MTFGHNPSIAADATRKALVENDGSAAFEATENASRAALDAQELREIERSLYYPTATSPDPAAAAPVPGAAVPVTRRSLIARLFRRR